MHKLARALGIKRKSNFRSFGIPLYKAVSHEQRKIPQVIEKCIEFLFEFGMSETDLFVNKVSTKSKPIVDLRHAFERGPVEEIADTTDVYAVASCLLYYMNLLPEALVPPLLYEGFIRTVELEDTRQRVDWLRTYISKLPEEHYNSFKLVLMFLHRYVDLTSPTEERLDEQLEIICNEFAPLILRPSKEVRHLNVSADGQKIETLVNFMIVNCPEIMRDTTPSAPVSTKAKSPTKSPKAAKGQSDQASVYSEGEGSRDGGSQSHPSASFFQHLQNGGNAHVVESDFPAEGEEELSVKAGEVVTVRSDANGWAMIENEHGESGWAPSDYLRPLSDAEMNQLHASAPTAAVSSASIPPHNTHKPGLPPIPEKADQQYASSAALHNAPTPPPKPKKGDEKNAPPSVSPSQSAAPPRRSVQDLLEESMARPDDSQTLARSDLSSSSVRFSPRATTLGGPGGPGGPSSPTTANLRASVSEMDNNLHRSSSQIDGLQTRASTMQEEMTKVQRMNESLRHDIANVRSEVMASRNSVSQVVAQEKAVEEEMLHTMELERSRLSREMQDIEHRYKHEMEELEDDFSRRQGVWETERQVLNNQLREAQDSELDLRSAVRRVEAESSRSLAIEADEKNRRVQALNQLLAEKSENERHLADQFDQLKLRHSDMMKDLRDLQLAHREQEDQLQLVNREYNYTASLLESERKRNSEQAETLKKSNVDLLEKERLVEQLEGDIAQLNAQVEQLTRDSKDQLAEKDRLISSEQARAEAVSQNEDEWRRRLADKAAENEELRMELDRLISERERLAKSDNDRESELQRIKSDARTDTSQMQEEIVRLQRDLNRVLTIKDEMEDRLKTARADHRILRSEFERRNDIRKYNADQDRWNRVASDVEISQNVSARRREEARQENIRSLGRKSPSSVYSAPKTPISASTAVRSPPSGDSYGFPTPHTPFTPGIARDYSPLMGTRSRLETRSNHIDRVLQSTVSSSRNPTIQFLDRHARMGSSPAVSSAHRENVTARYTWNSPASALRPLRAAPTPTSAASTSFRSYASPLQQQTSYSPYSKQTHGAQNSFDSWRRYGAFS